MKKEEKTGAFAELEQGVHVALETYSNVHRGSGHNSMVSTHLFEQSRDIILDYLGLKKGGYVVIFCTPRRAEALIKQLNSCTYQIVSSHEIGLPLGVRALVVKKKHLPGGIPFQTGGGTTKLISKEWVIWASAPDKFEAGTPAVINIIAFAKALLLIQKYGKEILMSSNPEKLTASEILQNDDLKTISGKELLDKFKKTHIGSNIPVPTREGLKPYINLDNSASTPTFTPIWNAFRQTLRQPEEVQQEIIQETKSICSEMLGAPLNAYDLIFTSNTTESINLAAESFSREVDSDVEPVVLNTLLEHSSNELPWRMIPEGSVIRLSIDDEGFLDLAELETKLSSYNKNHQHGKKRIKLVAVSGASNVLGVCNNLEEISKIVHKYGAKILVDGAQLIAHRKMEMAAWEIDYLAFSAHKVYAPFGCGVLVVKKGLLNFSSDELEHILSSGEENAGGIAALGKAFVILQRIGMDLVRKEEQELTKRALLGLSQVPGLTIYGLNDPNSPGLSRKLGVIAFILDGKIAHKISKELALQRGIGVRSGCLCAHILVKHILNIGPKLEKFQWLIQTLFPKLSLPGIVRMSLGIENSEEDVDILIQTLKKIGKGEKSSPVSKSDAKKQMDDFIRDTSNRVYSKIN